MQQPLELTRGFWPYRSAYYLRYNLHSIVDVFLRSPEFRKSFYYRYLSSASRNVIYDCSGSKKVHTRNVCVLKLSIIPITNQQGRRQLKGQRQHISFHQPTSITLTFKLIRNLFHFINDFSVSLSRSKLLWSRAIISRDVFVDTILYGALGGRSWKE